MQANMGLTASRDGLYRKTGVFTDTVPPGAENSVGVKPADRVLSRQVQIGRCK